MPSDRKRKPVRAALDWAREAVALDPEDAEAQAILAQLMLTLEAGNHDEGSERVSAGSFNQP